MTEKTRDSMFAMIRSNIARHGHHIYVVAGGVTPRFAYTIGLSEIVGTELVFAGASFFMVEDVTQIINKIATTMKTTPDPLQSVKVDSLGIFSLRNVDASWVNLLMLGAIDFYGTRQIKALQVVPDNEHSTLDIPNLSTSWNAVAEPVWRWLQESWEYPVPPQSTAVTNLAALRGESVTEAVRWEENQWELFAGAGPDVSQDEIRVVPLGTLLGIDDSLNVVTSLGIGQALWRESNKLEWHRWGK